LQQAKDRMKEGDDIFRKEIMHELCEITDFWKQLFKLHDVGLSNYLMQLLHA
jgi:hypothetical protein